MKRINYLYTLWDEFNEAEFGGKLQPITILIKRFTKKDGQYEYSARDLAGRPRREELSKANIQIASVCFKDEAHLQGTLLHEMIHQYQAEVLDRICNHDAVFTSIARRLERKYGFPVR